MSKLSGSGLNSVSFYDSMKLMNETARVQGREITQDDIELVRRLIESNPFWKCIRLSKELCLLWNWHTSNGQLKGMTCRSLLPKLELRGQLGSPEIIAGRDQ